MQKMSELSQIPRYAESCKSQSEKHYEKLQKRRLQMEKEGMYYTSQFNENIESGLSHNTATLKAIEDTTANFNPDFIVRSRYGRLFNSRPNAIMHERGRLVYIGAYRRLEYEYKSIVDLQELIQFLVDNIDGFDAIATVIRELVKNPTQAVKAVLHYLELTPENKYWYSELKTLLENSLVRGNV